eukprot:6919625-Pyramimonas_sp.AAC.1
MGNTVTRRDALIGGAMWAEAAVGIPSGSLGTFTHLRPEAGRGFGGLCLPDSAGGARRRTRP